MTRIIYGTKRYTTRLEEKQIRILTLFVPFKKYKRNIQTNHVSRLKASSFSYFPLSLTPPPPFLIPQWSPSGCSFLHSILIEEDEVKLKKISQDKRSPWVFLVESFSVFGCLLKENYKLFFLKHSTLASVSTISNFLLNIELNIINQMKKWQKWKATEINWKFSIFLVDKTEYLRLVGHQSSSFDW